MERIFQIGLVLIAAGLATATGWLIVVVDSTREFWALPAWIALALLVLGVLLTAVGLLGRTDNAARQQQSGGDGSINLQAGRDLRIEREGGG